MHHQLKADREMPCAILRTVPVPTGQEAIRLEKRLHSELKQTHPDCIVDTACYRGQIRVVSEIYDGSLTPTILARLGDIEAELGRRAS